MLTTGLILLQIPHILLELALFLSHWGEVSVDSRRGMAHLIQTGGSSMLNCWVIWFAYYVNILIVNIKEVNKDGIKPE